MKLHKIIGLSALYLAASLGIYNIGSRIFSRYPAKTAVIEDYTPQSEKPIEYKEPKINNISFEELSRKYPDLASRAGPTTGTEDNKIFFTDLDNDGKLELIIENCCAGSAAYGSMEVLNKDKGKYNRMDTIGYQGKIEIKDLDNDNIYEIVAWKTAPGQKALANAFKESWGEVYKLNNIKYQLTSLRIKNDGSITDADNPNPYNIQQEERHASNDLEQRLQYSQPYTNYPQNDIEAYQPVEHYLRLNLRVRSDVATDENIPYIRNARVNFIVRSNTKDERRLIDEPQFTDHNGIVRLHYNFLTTKNDDPTACIEIYAPNHEFYQGCYGISRLENERGWAYLDDRLQVIKGKGELGILGDFNDVSLEAELVNKEFGRRYTTDY